MRSDFHSGLRQNRTGIHGSHDAEHRGSGHLLARPNGTLHGSRATPLRKQREVQVVPSHRQRVEHILLQDFAICHHCRGLGTGRSKFGNERFLARIGFNHRQTKIKSGLLHGIRYQFASTPGRSIRSGEHCDHSKRSVSSASIFNDGTATSGVPANSTFSTKSPPYQILIASLSSWESFRPHQQHVRQRNATHYA